MLRRLKQLFSREPLYSETEVRQVITWTVAEFANEVKKFNAGAVDSPLDKVVDKAVERFLLYGPSDWKDRAENQR